MFLVAILANLGSEPLIAWFGPWLTLAPATFLLRRWLRRPVVFAVGIYGASIVLGIVAMEGFGMGNGDSARLAGWVLPPALALVGAGLLLFRRGWLVARLAPAELERVDASTSRGMGALGGAVAGTLLGAFGGALAYYIFDFGLLVDLVFPERADELLISASTVCGLVGGTYLGATEAAPATSR